MNDQLKIGDIVFAYKKGIWKIEEIIDRSHIKFHNSDISINDEIKLSLICRENGSFPKKKIYDSCDAGFVRKAIKVIDKEIERLNFLKNIVLENEKKN